jgi:hypothetical protein
MDKVHVQAKELDLKLDNLVISQALFLFLIKHLDTIILHKICLKFCLLQFCTKIIRT